VLIERRTECVTFGQSKIATEAKPEMTHN